MRPLAAIALLAALSACSPQDPDGRAAVPPADAPPPAPEAKPAAPAVLPADFAGDIDAVGTEPFWLLAIRKDELKLTRPDQADVVAPGSAPTMEGDRAVWATPTMRVTLTRATCSDGMSDRSFPLTAEVILGATVLRGCAAKPAVAPFPK